MSHENVETARATIDAWNRHDWDAILSLAAPEVEWDLTRAVGPMNGLYRGDELPRIWTEFAELWESATAEADTMMALGEHVVVGMTIRARGREGIEVLTRPAWVISFRAGRVTRFAMFQDLDEALASVDQGAPRNIDVVREIYAAIERGDTEAVLARYGPDVEWEFSRSPFRMVFKRTSYRGHAGLRAFIAERYEEAWAEIFDHLDDVIEAGDDVVTVVTSGGRGRASGAEVARTHAALWSFRDGRVIRVSWFASPEEALAAAGGAV